MNIYKNLSLESLPNEEWRDIAGFDGAYQVSNMGRVKSFSFLSPKGKILKQHIVRGYLKVHLSFHQKAKMVSTHRLVADCFINRSEFLTDVNHKDEDKLNNTFSNLEWCSKKYNDNYGSRNKKISDTQRNDTAKSKKVLQYSKDGELIKEWDSICEIGRAGFDRKGVSCVCRNKKNYKTSGGYFWKFKK